MDKAILKKFAIESRQDLMQKMESKIKSFYIDEEFNKSQNGDIIILSNDKHSLSLSKDEFDKRETLIKRINELGIEQVIEESAYTWFNRIVAIRYMEIHDYLPLTKDNQSLGIRVLSSKDNTPDPEILKFTNLVNTDLDINFKKEKFIEFKDENEKFKYVLLLICKKLGKVIPQVFDGVTDYIDILIPDNLLNDTGFVNKIITEVSEESYNQVEIIGWLYQYYNQSEKDRVMAEKRAYKKNEIAYATQLFTPDWIVKYMVENSLGRFWIEHQGNPELLKNWHYFINKNIDVKYEPINPKEIKCIDPCSGSGHILIYIFEILTQIYISYGYSKNEIPELILKNNIYGLDIDDRAGQLSILSIVLKAREYDKNIFNKNVINDLNILSIQDSTNLSNVMQNINLTDSNTNICKYLEEVFQYSKELGSLINVEEYDYDDLKKEIERNDNIFGIEAQKRIIPLIKQALILSNKYDIVITNPPYMASKWMSNVIKKYLEKEYLAEKNDLFSAFIKKCINICKDNGNIGMITMQSLLFLSSYIGTRSEILNLTTIESLLQIGYNSFPELNSQVAHAVSFVLKKAILEKQGVYFNLNTGKTNDDKDKVYISRLKENKFYLNSNNDFKKMPNLIIAYWLNDSEKNILTNKDLRLENKMDIKQGLATGDNEKFVRLWTEVDHNKIGIGFENTEQFIDSGKLYAPYNKGGDFRKWYGNREFIIKFNSENYNILLNSGNHLPSRDYYFKDGITWSLIGNDNFAARISNDGFVFDVGGSSGFPIKKEDTLKILAFLCSKVTINFLKMLNPTINFQVGDIKNLPFLNNNDEAMDEVKSLSEECIEIAKQDWDSYETSWDFKKNPLLMLNAENKKSLKSIYTEFEEKSNKLFAKLKNNEEKINEILINMYGLNDVVEKSIEDKIVAFHKPNKELDIKNLISFSVGCMFGRYSLDIPGLVYAGGNFDKIYEKAPGLALVDENGEPSQDNPGGWAGVSLSNYQYLRNDNKDVKLSYYPDLDNIIPITDDAYFKDDIVERFKKFIAVAYGKETLNENIDFIADTLGKKGTETSEETIRRYFLNDFYNDHVKMYQKRPIYWLFDSGKKNGFKALIYMHRYNENTVAKVRLDYLHRMQTTYDKLLSDVNYKLTTDLSMTDKKMMQNKQADLNAKLQEINEYDEKIAHIANQRISIDLDDGIKVNYNKFKDILAKIK